VAVALGTGEVGLRIGGYTPGNVNPLMGFNQRDPVLGHRGRPHFSRRFTQPDFDVAVAHDADGFRVPARPPAGPPHVLVFGDSFTWGWGVDQGQVFTDVLAAARQDIGVHNLAISGTATVVAYKLFETTGWRARIAAGDTVIVSFFRNDFDDNLSGRLRGRPDGTTEVADPTWNERFDRLKSLSYLFNFVAFQVEQRVKLHRGAQLESMGLAAESVSVARQFLGKFQDDCRSRQARFLVLAIPDRSLFGEGTVKAEDFPHGRVAHDTLLALTKQLGIDTLDLLPVFRQAARVAPLTFERDPHWNARGHAIAARVVEEALANQTP